MACSVAVLLSVLVALGSSTVVRPDVEEDVSLPSTPDTQLGTYTGPQEREGQGNMTWPDGSSYQVKDILGITRQSTMSIMQGSWAQGKFEGSGMMIFMLGDYQAKYEGSWTRGMQVRKEQTIRFYNECC